MGFGIKTKLKKLFPQPINTPIIIMPSSGSELKDKVVLISGGTGGIGLEIARNFLLSGAKVIITGTNERKFEKIKSEISNDKLKFIVLDYTPLNPIKRFTTPEEIAQIAKILVSDLGNTIVGQTIYMSGGRGIVEIR